MEEGRSGWRDREGCKGWSEGEELKVLVILQNKCSESFISSVCVCVCVCVRKRACYLCVCAYSTPTCVQNINSASSVCVCVCVCVCASGYVFFFVFFLPPLVVCSQQLASLLPQSDIHLCRSLLLNAANYLLCQQPLSHLFPLSVLCCTLTPPLTPPAPYTHTHTHTPLTQRKVEFTETFAYLPERWQNDYKTFEESGRAVLCSYLL